MRRSRCDDTRKAALKKPSDSNLPLPPKKVSTWSRKKFGLSANNDCDEMRVDVFRQAPLRSSNPSKQKRGMVLLETGVGVGVII